MTDYFSYGPCSVCGKQLVDDDEVHDDGEGGDCHRACCPVCHPELVCCVCGAPATVQIEVVRSDVDPDYASVCATCAAKHTVNCIDWHHVARRYKLDWPDYCRACGGHGYHYYPGNREEPPDFDTCCECIEVGKCPRCGFEHNEDWDGEACSECGWNTDDPDAGLPVVECECGLADDWYYENEPFSYNDLPDHDY